MLRRTKPNQNPRKPTMLSRFQMVEIEDLNVAAAITIVARIATRIVGKIGAIADAEAITRIEDRGFRGSAMTSRPSCSVGHGNLPGQG